MKKKEKNIRIKKNYVQYKQIRNLGELYTISINVSINLIKNKK